MDKSTTDPTKSNNSKENNNDPSNDDDDDNNNDCFPGQAMLRVLQHDTPQWKQEQGQLPTADTHSASIHAEVPLHCMGWHTVSTRLQP